MTTTDKDDFAAHIVAKLTEAYNDPVMEAVSAVDEAAQYLAAAASTRPVRDFAALAGLTDLVARINAYTAALDTFRRLTEDA